MLSSPKDDAAVLYVRSYHDVQYVQETNIHVLSDDGKSSPGCFYVRVSRNTEERMVYFEGVSVPTNQAYPTNFGLDIPRQSPMHTL